MTPHFAPGRAQRVVVVGNYAVVRDSSRESILWWIVTTHARRNAAFARLRASGAYPELQWIELRHPRDAEGLLQAVEAQARSA